MDLQITFRDMEPSPAVREHVETRAAKALASTDRAVSAHVVLSQPHRHHHHGTPFHVAIDVLLPHDHVVVSPKDGKVSHANMYAAIDDAFAALERQLHAHAVKRSERGEATR